MKRLPWCVAAACALAIFLLFQPGYFTFDSAHQWWMARTGNLDTSHPIAMVRLWQASAALLPDPQGFFALQLALIWGGLAFVVTALPLRTPAKLGVLLGIGLWPAFFALQPQVWKDLWMVGALLWAVGALLREQRMPAWRWRVFALLALALAGSLRFNALPALLPLWAWLAWQVYAVPVSVAERTAPRASMPDAQQPSSGRARVRFMLALVSLPLMLGLMALPDRLGNVKSLTIWPVLPLWDLAAISIDTGEMRIPPVFLKSGATVDDLARDFRPQVNVPSFATGTIQFYYELEVAPADLADLRRTWLALPFESAAWWRHRARVSSYLFGLRNAELPDSAVLMPDLMPFQDNPPLTMAPSSVRETLVAFWHARVDGPFFMGWLYLLLAFAVTAVAWRRRLGLPLALAASSWGMALPLFALAPAADFRYLLWTVVASLLAAMLAGVTIRAK